MKGFNVMNYNIKPFIIGVWHECLTKSGTDADFYFESMQYSWQCYYAESEESSNKLTECILPKVEEGCFSGVYSVIFLPVSLQTLSLFKNTSVSYILMLPKVDTNASSQEVKDASEITQVSITDEIDDDIDKLAKGDPFTIFNRIISQWNLYSKVHEFSTPRFYMDDIIGLIKKYRYQFHYETKIKGISSGDVYNLNVKDANPAKLLYFMGKSCSGKDTIANAYMTTHTNDSIKGWIPSITGRLPRNTAEHDSPSVLFLNEYNMKSFCKSNAFLEYREYEIAGQGKKYYASALPDTIIKGATYVSVSHPKAYQRICENHDCEKDQWFPILLVVPDDELKSRYKDRANAYHETDKTTDIEKEYERRFLADKYDFEYYQKMGLLDNYSVIINDGRMAIDEIVYAIDYAIHYPEVSKFRIEYNQISIRRKDGTEETIILLFQSETENPIGE